MIFLYSNQIKKIYQNFIFSMPKNMFIEPSMIYGEMIIGMPGVGKTTYIKEKKNLLSNRNIFTVNLDPGYIDDDSKYKWDFDIRKFHTTKNTMKKDKIGPNLAVKNILENYCFDYEHFRDIFLEEDKYYLIDTPGQIESILHLEKFLLKLQRDDIKLVNVLLVDLTSFISFEMLTNTYFISLQTMIALNNTQVNVITKCDLIGKIETIQNIRNIANVDLDTKRMPKFLKLIYEFVEKESLICYEFLEYKQKIITTLQYAIDQASGYFLEITEPDDLNKYLQDVELRDDIISDYEKIEKTAEKSLK